MNYELFNIINTYEKRVLSLKAQYQLMKEKELNDVVRNDLISLHQAILLWMIVIKDLKQIADKAHKT